MASWDIETSEPEGTPGPKPGSELTIRIWSNAPNDLLDVVLALHHEVAGPSGTDAEWRQHLREQRAEANKRQAEAQAEAQARTARCYAHHEDEDCWGKGGYDGAQKRQAAWAEESRKAAEVARKAAEVARKAPPPKPFPPQPQEPDGPPPLAQTETPPPRPSLHAEWVDGYWHWTGFAYLWLTGWWRVPDSDRETQQTAIAPAPPPQPRAEEMLPPPGPGLTWRMGAWAWNGRIWVWVPGGWALPPRADLVWRPARWILQGGGVRLDPGGWQVQVTVPR